MLKDRNWHYYKIPDSGLDFKPYDFTCRGPDGGFSCEAKAVAKDTLRWDDIRPNQRKGLGDVARWEPKAAQVIVYSTSRAQWVCWPYLTLRATFEAAAWGSVDVFNHP